MALRHFKRRLMLLILSTVIVNSQSAIKCPERCHCRTSYHTTDGPSIEVECRIGGMNHFPADQLDRQVYELTIAPQPNDPNNLTIGPVLTQPVPFSNLHVLTVINSNIPLLGKYSFWGLPNLKTLNLTGNRLTNISADNFRGLVNLTTLCLDHNHIGIMASESFRELPSLTSLSLSHNNLHILVPRQFRMLSKLKMLDLSYNRIQELDPEIFKDIQNILVFKCRKCSLIRINVQIYHIAPFIEELDLGDNLIEYVEVEDFSNLKNLKKLHFDHNQISVILDNVFIGNPLLKYLGLSDNLIVLLSSGFLNNVSNLTHLDISNNRLEKITSLTFAPSNKSLRSINLSGNNLQSTEIEEVLRVLPGLQDIGLSNLSLKVIPEDIFQNNKQLTSLDISSNQMTELPKILLENTRNLQYLDISKNKITNLDESDLRRLEAISKVNLLSNPYYCDKCEMEVIFTYMNTSVLNGSLRGLQCHSPLQLRGVYFADLLKEFSGPCIARGDLLTSLGAGMSAVFISVCVTAVIALYCTRTRDPEYATNERKPRRRDHDHPEELLPNTNNDSVSTIHSPYDTSENSR